MGQQEIVEILKIKYPEYLPFNKIFKKANSNRPAVFRAIRCLIKRDEIEYVIKQVDTVNGFKWKKFYRTRRD